MIPIQKFQIGGNSVPQTVLSAVDQALELLDIPRTPEGLYCEDIYQDVLTDLGADQCTVRNVTEWLKSMAPFPYVYYLGEIKGAPDQVNVMFYDYPYHDGPVEFKALERSYDQSKVYERLVAIHKAHMDAKAIIVPPFNQYTREMLHGGYGITVDRTYQIRILQYNCSLRQEDLPPSLREKDFTGKIIADCATNVLQ